MNTTTAVAAIRPVTLPRRVLRWMPTFLGFPAGGLAAKLIIGRVDHLGAAVAGGAITGALIGVAQWLGLRRTGLSPELWVGATAVGLAIGLGAGAAAVGYQTDLAALAAQGAISGLAVGLTQALVLHRRLGRIVAGWPAVLAALWALGWIITSAAGIDVEAQYTVFGSSGALIVTALTSVLPIELARRQQRAPR
jgi:hypothetical protein